MKAYSLVMAATCKEGAQHAQQVAVSTSKQNEVIQFIRRVSKQTILLGINTAIEATRAGQYGAGFQIVA